MTQSRKKITVLLDEPDFHRFEAFCTERGHKKSTLIVRLVREHLDKEEFTMQQELPLSKGDAGEKERVG